VSGEIIFEMIIVRAVQGILGMFVSTFTGAASFQKGTVMSSLQLSSALLYGIVSLNNVVYVSAHDDNVPLIMTMVARLRR